MTLESNADPYDVLGVAASASDTELRAAFRRKASLYHPDRNPDPRAAQWFRQAQEAFDLLSDSQRRRAHDEKRQRHLLEDPAASARAMFARYLDDLE
jgi:DnaJ-class molecular chaperone